jgi:DNA invertase Pin-like site-specific DNA recombinase
LAVVAAPKAIGIVRVSQVRGREGDSFASPNEQRGRIEAECGRQGLRLEKVIEELDVSGGTPLTRREGLRGAVEAVEAGEASAIVVAYFDRLVRSLRVQAEIVERVEAVGGQVLAVDVGAITNGSASQWLSSTLLGAVAEHQRRVTAERVGEAQKRAIARGVAPWKNTTPGYRRNADQVFEPDPDTAPAVVEAFRMRAAGKSVAECRRYLVAHGVDRCQAAVGRLFQDRAVLGELHFGELHNLEAHEPIVTPELFAAAGRASTPRGRVGKSDRLLARLGVLRCVTCDSRLVAGSSNHGSTPGYRCRNPDCPRKVTISANLVEPIVIDAACERAADVEGRASAEAEAQGALTALEKAQDELDAGIRTLAGFEDEAAARERLAELRQVRDDAQEKVDRLSGSGEGITINARDDWHRLSPEGRRDVIKATIRRIAISPDGGRRGDNRGRRERVAIEFVGE